MREKFIVAIRKEIFVMAVEKKAIVPVNEISTTASKADVKPVAAEAKAEDKKAAKPVAKKATAKKATAKKTTTKKATATKTAAAKKPAAAKKTAEKKTAAKPATKAAIKSTYVVELSNGEQYDEARLTKIAKDVWKYDLKQKVADLKSIELYIKPEEHAVYYVMNTDFTGQFGI